VNCLSIGDSARPAPLPKTTAGCEDLKRTIAAVSEIWRTARHLPCGYMDTIYGVPVAMAMRASTTNSCGCCIYKRPNVHEPWLELLDASATRRRSAYRRGFSGNKCQSRSTIRACREALMHGGLRIKQRTVVEWVEASEIDSPGRRAVCGMRLAEESWCRRVLFGQKRGIQGMVHAIEYARSHKTFHFSDLPRHAMRRR